MLRRVLLPWKNLSVSLITMTDKKETRLIKDLKSIPSPVFYIFAAVALFCGLFVYGITLTGVITSVFLILLVACASSDIKDGIVPDLILILIAVLAAVKIILLEMHTLPNIAEHIAGALIISVPMLITALIVKGAFGGGDIKLMAAAGLYMAWRATLGGAVLGICTAGIYGIVLIILKKANKTSKIRLAPFLVYGLAIFSLYYEQLFNRLSIVAQMC